MPTIQQLVRKGRQQMEYKSKSPALDSCPQRRGVTISSAVLLTPAVSTVVASVVPNTVPNARNRPASKDKSLEFKV